MKLSLLLLLSLPLAPGGQESDEQPTLVEAARKAREARLQQAAPVRVITNQDLEGLTRAHVSRSAPRVRPSSAMPTPPPGALPAEESSPEGLDLEAWETRFQEMRLDLKNAVHENLVLQLKLNNLRNAFFREDDGTTQGMIQGQLEQTLQQLRANQQQIEEWRKALELLKKKAQVAGVPAGKIRDWTQEIADPPQIISEETPNP